MNATRHPAVAGSFYPNQAEELNNLVSNLLDAATPAPCNPKILIVPHAGYIYSGLTAAYAYKTLANRKQCIKEVVLLGPSHRVGFQGIAVPTSEQFETPIGLLPLNKSLIEKSLALPQVKARDDAHLMEHSLEVQLPFLQCVLDQFTLAPFVIGHATSIEVAELLETVWGDDETLIVISSDLSHYHPYACAQIIDAATSKKINALDDDLVGDQACGCHGINGALQAAKRHGLKVQTLDVRNSGDTAGSKDRVVGYGAYALQ